MMDKERLTVTEASLGHAPSSEFSIRYIVLPLKPP